MPQGKGTYGSQVGRPSKKKYQVGGVIDEPALEAAQMGQELESIPLQSVEPEIPIEEPEIPAVNAPDRMEVSPDLTEYNEGGKVKSEKVDVTDIVKEIDKPYESKTWSAASDREEYLRSEKVKKMEKEVLK